MVCYNLDRDVLIKELFMFSLEELRVLFLLNELRLCILSNSLEIDYTSFFVYITLNISYVLRIANGLFLVCYCFT